MTKFIKTEPADVNACLKELGLTLDILREAILIGESARDACTPNDPPGAPGFFAWARTVRGLREILIPSGWTRDDDGNLSTVVSPEGRFAIAIATGDEGTGNAAANPKTKYPKGPATVAAVERNQLAFPFLKQQAKGREPTTETWMLVRRRTANRVWAELSLPSFIGDDGRIDGWALRIIMEPIELEPTTMPESASEAGDTINVNITRRARS